MLNANNVHRPSASAGWWLCCLLPGAYLVNCWQHQRALSFDYKLSTIVAFGLLLQSLVQIGRMYTSTGRLLVFRAIPSAVTATLIHVCLHQGIAYRSTNPPRGDPFAFCRFHFKRHHWSRHQIHIQWIIFLRASAHAQEFYVRRGVHRNARCDHIHFECFSENSDDHGAQSSDEYRENEYDFAGNITLHRNLWEPHRF